MFDCPPEARPPAPIGPDGGRLCAASSPLPGEITEVEIVVQDGKGTVFDRGLADEEAAKDGDTWTRRPGTSPKPTRDEILAEKAADGRNRVYRAYVSPTANHRRAQERSIPEFEAEVLRAAQGGFKWPARATVSA